MLKIRFPDTFRFQIEKIGEGGVWVWRTYLICVFDLVYGINKCYKLTDTVVGRTFTLQYIPTVEYTDTGSTLVVKHKPKGEQGLNLI